MFRILASCIRMLQQTQQQQVIATTGPVCWEFSRFCWQCFNVFFQPKWLQHWYALIFSRVLTTSRIFAIWLLIPCLPSSKPGLAQPCVSCLGSGGMTDKGQVSIEFFGDDIFQKSWRHLAHLLGNFNEAWFSHFHVAWGQSASNSRLAGIGALFATVWACIWWRCKTECGWASPARVDFSGASFFWFLVVQTSANIMPDCLFEVFAVDELFAICVLQPSWPAADIVSCCILLKFFAASTRNHRTENPCCKSWWLRPTGSKNLSPNS